MVAMKQRHLRHIRIAALASVGIWSCSDNPDLPAASGTDAATDGLSPPRLPLIVQKPELPGSHCPAGGTAIEVGIDDNGDGMLQADEVRSTSYVCNGTSGDAGANGVNGDAGANGANGDSGANGINALVRVDIEPSGANCPHGGLAVRTGADTDADGKLSDAEVTSTSYLCKDPGQSALVRLDAEPIGSNCPKGGTAIKVGIDKNGDGTLQDAEVTSTSYVCNAPPFGGGTVLNGSFTIHNSLDVAFLQQFTEVTGNVQIEAPGLTSISLPALAKVGRFGTSDGMPDVTTVDLPVLQSAGAFSMLSTGSLSTFSAPNLQTVKAEVQIGAYGSAIPVSLPALASAGSITLYGLITSVDLGALTTSGPLAFKLTNPASIDLPSLTTVSDDFEISGVSSFAAPKLSTIDLTKNPYQNNFQLQASSGVALPALTALNYNCVSPHATGYIDGGSGKIDLSGLQSIDCWPISLKTSGSVDLRSLAHVKRSILDIQSAAALDLSLLTTIETAGSFYASLNISWSALTTLDLPTLTAGWVSLGWCNVNYCGSVCSGQPNSQLVSVNAPLYNSGQITFAANPTFPKCRADALIAQVGMGSIQCALASGPCP
jgi:hypothetical protein